MRFLEPIGFLYNNGNIINHDLYATNGNPQQQHYQHQNYHHANQTTNLLQNRNLIGQNESVINSNTTTVGSTTSPYIVDNDANNPNITITSDSVIFSKNLNLLRNNVTGSGHTTVPVSNNTIISKSGTTIVPPPIPPRNVARALQENTTTYHQQENLNNLNCLKFKNKIFNDNDQSLNENVVTKTTTDNKNNGWTVDNGCISTIANNTVSLQTAFQHSEEAIDDEEDDVDDDDDDDAIIDEEDDVEPNHNTTRYIDNGNNDNINLHQHFHRSNDFANSCTVRHDVANLARRENLAKLDFEAAKATLQRRSDDRHVRHNGAGGGGDVDGGGRLHQSSPITCSPSSAVSSPDDSFMDDEDAFCPSPSTYMSHDSPEPSNCRGIINPNYPGFQHLAHTLSEHFFDHQFEHSSEDSDLSEFETESSRESSPDQPQQEIDNNNRNNLNNNINNNNGNLDKIEDILKGAFVSRANMLPAEITNDEDDHEGDVKSTTAAYDLQSMARLPLFDAEQNFKTIHDYTQTAESNVDLLLEPVRDEDDDLKTYLSRYESPVELMSSIEPAYQPPDILLKSSSSQDGIDIQLFSDTPDRIGKPDILQHVDEEAQCERGKSADESGSDFVSVEWSRCSMTPVVDIVGNFEQEVEHEIGLIVSGYRSSTSSLEELSALAAALEQATSELHALDKMEHSFDKMTDAALSNAKETITTTIRTAIECKSDAKAAGGVEEVSELTHCTSNQTDVALVEVPSSTSLPIATTSDEAILVEKCRKNSIPTAIVKPKYQRKSYDDRQLPPVVCIDREKPWYHNSTTTAITTSNNNNQQQPQHSNNNNVIVGSSHHQQKKIQQLPHFERKHKKSLPVRNAANTNITTTTTTNNTTTITNGVVSEKEKFNSSRLCEKDIDSSSVAIVPPRKKETIVMEPQQQTIKTTMPADLQRSPPTNIYVNDGDVDNVSYADDDKRIDSCSIQNNMANISNNNNNSSKCGNNNNKNNNNHHHHQRPHHHHPLHNYGKGSTKTTTTTTTNAGGAGAAAAATTSSITINRKVLPEKREKLSAFSTHTARHSKDISANFDVYNIETALPKIDLEAIENHLKAAKEEERRKRNDRKEILRRLALGTDYESHKSDKPARKPSLHSRLQGGMNLQICFMNDTASDTESPSSDSESCPKLSKSQTFSNQAVGYQSRYSTGSHPYHARPLSVNIKRGLTTDNARPSSLQLAPRPTSVVDDSKEIDFFTKQARLQIEARMALAQAKDMAHMQMEMDRQKQKQSPITEIIRNSLEKVGIALPPEKRRVSRQMLTDMNIAQLQVIVNELHTQIERLNENLVQYLMERDELHMSQDSMLVDIEDLTRYLGAKEQTNDHQKQQLNQTAVLMTSQSQTRDLTKPAIAASMARRTASSSSASQTTNRLIRMTNLVKK